MQTPTETIIHGNTYEQWFTVRQPIKPRWVISWIMRLCLVKNCLLGSFMKINSKIYFMKCLLYKTIICYYNILLFKDWKIAQSQTCWQLILIVYSWSYFLAVIASTLLERVFTKVWRMHHPNIKLMIIVNSSVYIFDEMLWFMNHGAIYKTCNWITVSKERPLKCRTDFAL